MSRPRAAQIRPLLSADACYRLALLSGRPRFYQNIGLLRGMAKRGLIALTGRADENGRVEWTITEAGRAALHAKASSPVIAEDVQQLVSERKGA
jgi:hypothetical protein